MNISAYLSNIQSYSDHSGTKFALDGDGTVNKLTSIQQDNADKEPSITKDTKVAEGVVQSVDISKEQLQKMVEEMDEFINSINRSLSFRVDDKSGRDIVTIYEASTGEIIRQIPDEEMLMILRRLASLSSGGFVEEIV